MDRVDILQGLTMQEVQWKGKEHNCADSCLGDVPVPWPTVWVQLGECMLNSAVGLPSSAPSAWKGAQSRAGRTKKMEPSWENLAALFFIGTRTEFMLKSIHHLQTYFTYELDSLSPYDGDRSTFVWLDGNRFHQGFVLQNGLSQSPCEFPGCVKPTGIFTQVHIRRNTLIPLGPKAILTSDQLIKSDFKLCDHHVENQDWKLIMLTIRHHD